MINKNLSNNIVVHIKKGNQSFLQFKRLLQYSTKIVHCYSVGLDRNYRTFLPNNLELQSDVYKKNMNDYKTLCEANNLDYQYIIKARQTHTNNVSVIKQSKREKTFDTLSPTDGLVTNEKDIILATTNADCILMLFYDPKKNVIANVHSGWRGTLQEISVKTIQKMKDTYGCRPEDIIVCFCPSIRKCHFEVDKDVYQLFYKQFNKLGNVESFITKNAEKWNIDTVLINKILLKQMGILEENIEDCNICSVCNKDLIHSYRAEGSSYGLETALISII